MTTMASVATRQSPWSQRSRACRLLNVLVNSGIIRPEIVARRLQIKINAALICESLGPISRVHFILIRITADGMENTPCSNTQIASKTQHALKKTIHRRTRTALMCKHLTSSHTNQTKAEGTVFTPTPDAISPRKIEREKTQWLPGAHAASPSAAAGASSDGGASALAPAERDLTKSRRRRLTSLE